MAEQRSIRFSAKLTRRFFALRIIGFDDVQRVIMPFSCPVKTGGLPTGSPRKRNCKDGRFSSWARPRAAIEITQQNYKWRQTLGLFLTLISTSALPGFFGTLKSGMV